MLRSIGNSVDRSMRLATQLPPGKRMRTVRISVKLVDSGPSVFGAQMS